jgi:hypothetical protein
MEATNCSGSHLYIFWNYLHNIARNLVPKSKSKYKTTFFFEDVHP